MKKKCKNTEKLTLTKVTVTQLAPFALSKVVGGDVVLQTIQGPDCPPDPDPSPEEM